MLFVIIFSTVEMVARYTPILCICRVELFLSIVYPTLSRLYPLRRINIILPVKYKNILCRQLFYHKIIFAALCSQSTFSKNKRKSPPRKSKMDIFKMSKMKNFRILLQTTFLNRLLFEKNNRKNSEN